MAIMQEKTQKKNMFKIEWLIPRARIDYLDIIQGMQTVTDRQTVVYFVMTK